MYIYNRIIYLSLSLLHLNMMARYEIQCIINNKIYRKIHYFHYYNYTCPKGRVLECRHPNNKLP